MFPACASSREWRRLYEEKAAAKTPKTHKGKKAKGRKRCNDEPIAAVQRRDVRKLRARPLPKKRMEKEENKFTNKPGKKLKVCKDT